MGTIMSMEKKAPAYNYEEALLNDYNGIQPDEVDLSINFPLSYCDTVWDLFCETVKANPTGRFLGKVKVIRKDTYGTYEWYKYSESMDRIKALANGLQLSFAALFEKENSSEAPRVGIWAENGPGWVETFMALQAIGWTAVPIYRSFGQKTGAELVTRAGLVLLVASKANVEKLIAAKEKGSAPTVLAVVQIDNNEVFGVDDQGLEPAVMERARAAGVVVTEFSEVLKQGLSNVEEFGAKKVPKDVPAYIMFTPGTTGPPKGVFLTNGNVLSAVKSLAKKLDFSVYGAFYSLTPLAHVSQIVVLLLMIAHGLPIGFATDGIKLMLLDLGQLRPYYLACVPHALHRIYDKIISSVEKKTPLKQAYYRKALKKAIKYTREVGDPSNHKVNEKPVWKTVRASMGLENMLLVLVFAGTPRDEVMELLRFLVPDGVYSVYGLVETAGLAAITPKHNPHLRHVGLPAGLELQLEPERSKPPSGGSPTEAAGGVPSESRGEVLLRGARVFSHYLGEAESPLEGGWLRTGDVGRLSPSGALSVLHREADPFELATGERVRPERAELVYSQCPAVHQVFVCGGVEEDRPVAIVVPAVNWCLKKLKAEEASKELCQKAELYYSERKMTDFRSVFFQLCGMNRAILTQKVLAEMFSVDEQLNGFERVHAVHLELEIDNSLNGFTVDNECMTPMFRLRRKELSGRYCGEMVKLYDVNKGKT